MKTEIFCLHTVGIFSSLNLYINTLKTSIFKTFNLKFNLMKCLPKFSDDRGG